MADEPQVSGIVSLTVPVVMTFPNLITPKAFTKKGKSQGEPKYSANFSFEVDSEDLKTLKATAAKIAKAKWPGRELKELSFPFTSGDKLADKAKAEGKNREYYRGKVVVAARTIFEPVMSGIENGKLVDYEGEARKLASTKFYSGVEVLAQVNFVAYEGVGNNPDGVTAYLNKVFTTGKGKRLGGSVSSAEAFKDYMGKMTTEDPTQGASVEDEEIPF